MNTQLFAPTIVIVMLSLGLSLTMADFRRAASMPRPICAALFCQTILLPAACFAITQVFALPPALAVGLMLMSACPGGTMASVFSHLADGDLALNLTLTAINGLLSIVSLPLIVGASIFLLVGDIHTIPLQYAKVLETFALVLVPVAAGMVLRDRFPNAARRLQRPTKVLAGCFVLGVGTLAVITGWATLAAHFVALGAAVLSLGIVSLITGYAVPHLMRLERRQSVAIALEIGLHNGALAIAIASNPHLLGNAEMAVPAALYGILMPFVAMAFIASLQLRYRQLQLAP